MKSNNYYSEHSGQVRKTGEGFGEYFRLSRVWAGENLKRFWAIPAFVMLCYLLTLLLPIMTDFDTSYAESIAGFRNAGLTFYSILFPLITTLTLNRYLFGTGSVNVTHSLPLTRGRLWFSNFLCGLLMMWVPTAITYALIAVIEPDHIAGLETSFFKLILCQAFYLTLFNLAAILTGNIVMHIITSAFLTLLPLATVLAFLATLEMMIYGFQMDWFLNRQIFGFVPPMAMTANDSYNFAGESFGWWYYVLVAAFAIALYAAGAYLYSRRKLERAGDSFVFKPFQLFFVSCAAIAGGGVLGTLFWSLWGGTFPWNLGLPLGAAIAFAIAKMSAAKTLRIFNKGSLCHLAISFALLLIVLGAFEFDLFGMERHVPDADEIVSADVSFGVLPTGLDLSKPVTITDPEAIDAVREIHELAVNSDVSLRPDYFQSDYVDRYENRSVRIIIDYALKNGRTFRRAWTATMPMFADSDAFRRVIDGEEFQAAMNIENAVKDKHISGIHLELFHSRYYEGYYGNIYGISLNSVEYAPFLRALQADRDKVDFVAAAYTELPDALFEVEIGLLDYLEDEDPRRMSDWFRVRIGDDYSNTIQWLREQGYYDALTEQMREASEYTD